LRVARISLRAAATPSCQMYDTTTRQAGCVSNFSTGILQVSAVLPERFRRCYSMCWASEISICGYTFTISERPQELAFHFRAHQREIDHRLAAPLNGIKHLQSEAKLHSKTGNPCEASLKTSGTRRLSSAGPRP